MDENLELLPLFIFGAEGDDNSGDDPSTDDSTGGQEDPQENSDDSEDGDDDHDDADDPKVKGLRSALAKQRAKDKAQERELRELRKLKKAQDQKELEEKSEIEQEKIKREKAEERATKLAAGFRTRVVDSAIKEAARKANFLDIDDALAGVDREALTVEQDEDDPSNVSVDTKAVEKAVKALATRKPHFIKQGTSDGEATGSPFGGPKGKKGETTEEAYRKQYPGL